MKNRILNLSILTLLLAGCAHNGDQLPEVVQIKKVTPYHKVSEGDTVGSIARKYGMKQADLIKLNKLEQPYQLYDGQRLIITPKVDDDITAPADPDIKVQQMKEESEMTSNPADSEEAQQDKTTIDDVNKEEIADEESVTPATTSEYIWPVSNGKERISQHFDGSDGGLIIDASDGTPVKSIADGVVVIAGVPNGEAAAYGITVVIKHTAKKTMSIYSNLKETSVKVKQVVKQGSIIGKVGQTGTIAKKPQLYFEINDLAGKGRKAIDPEKLIG